MTIRSILLIIGVILWLAAAGCWWRARGNWRLSREGWLFLILGIPFFVAGWFFTSSSYPGEAPPPTPAAEVAVMVTPPPPRAIATPAPVIKAEPATYAEAVNAAQRAAVARYPELGKRGTEFNARFVEAYRQLRIDDPRFFVDPEWPLHLADEIARTPPAPP